MTKFLFAGAVICLVCSSCTAIMRSYIKEDDSQIPIGFGKEKYTIVVLKHSKSYNKKVEKRFKKFYTGDYIMAGKEELNTRYNDSAKYRYILDNSKYYVSTSMPGALPQDRTPGAVSVSFVLKDRVTGETFGADVSSGMYTKVLKAYLQKLEKVRKKNAQG